MYLDIISYSLAEGVSEEKLLEEADKVLNSWMTYQEGFFCWQIGKKTGENQYMDIVSWRSKEDAKRAEENMKDIAKDSGWLACYDMSSISNAPLEQLTMFHNCKEKSE